MVSSNKLIEHIAGGVMLGSFATYAQRQGCCNSGKRGQDNVDQQSIMQTESGNLVFADDSNLPTEKQSPETQVREKIVNRYIYRDKPVEKVVYQNKIIEKEIPLTGTIDFGSGKTIWNADLLFNYVKLVEQVTGSKITENSFYQKNAELDSIYINHKNELNADINFDKVKECIDNIKAAEIKIYKDFNDLFESENEKTEHKKVVEDFMIKINSIIFHILLSTYEKTLMELFNYYEFKDEASGAIDKKRNICSCVNIKDRINSVYNEWGKLNFFSNIKTFFVECDSVIDLNKKLFEFYKTNINNKYLTLQILSDTLKIENANGSYTVDEYGNKTKSIKYVLRYSTMQIFVDFVLGINRKILDKLSFLANDNVNSERLTLTIYANSTLEDLFLFTNKGSRKDSSMYTLIDKIIFENFNTLKRIYDDLCFIENDMFSKVCNYTSHIRCKGNMCDISSLDGLYSTIKDRNSDLCKYIKSNVFEFPVVGNNKSTTKSSVSIPMEGLLNVKISQGSYIDLPRKFAYITKIEGYDFITSIDKQ